MNFSMTVVVKRLAFVFPGASAKSGFIDSPEAEPRKKNYRHSRCYAETVATKTELFTYRSFHKYGML